MNWYNLSARQCKKAIKSGQGFVAVLPVNYPPPANSPLLEVEEERFSRVKVPKARRGHEMGRMVLRELLGVGAIRLQTGENGKPYLDHHPTFNLSHSGDFLAIAIAETPLLGIDIEGGPRRWDVKPLFKRVCHPHERHWLATLPEANVMHGFLTCWTRKEAVQKATGTGLIDDLFTIDTQLEAPAPQLTTPPVNLWNIPLPWDACVCSLALDKSITEIWLAIPGQGPILLRR